MQITKIGHCCLFIKEQGLTVLTDPGTFSDGQNSVTGIDLILITHEHQDHLHIDSLKQVLKNNPQAVIATNTAVGKLLDAEKIPHQILEHGQNQNFKEVLIEGFGTAHADIYEGIVPVQNTGYFINNKFFYPGDAFTNPGKPVEILAIPVAGPWMHIRESINYGKTLKPKFVFPVHDGFFNQYGGFFATIVQRFVESPDTKFIIPEGQSPMEF